MDLGERIGHVEAQILPTLAAGADHPLQATPVLRRRSIL
jgi:hypothetical protein